jgi:hypothetical protein
MIVCFLREYRKKHQSKSIMVITFYKVTDPMSAKPVRRPWSWM